MKTFRILICLLLGVLLANAQTIFSNPVIKTAFTGSSVTPTPLIVDIGPKYLPSRGIISSDGSSVIGYNVTQMAYDNSTIVGGSFSSNISFYKRIRAGVLGTAIFVSSSGVSILYTGGASSPIGFGPISSGDSIWATSNSIYAAHAASESTSSPITFRRIEMYVIANGYSFSEDYPYVLTGTGGGVRFITSDGLGHVFIVTNDNRLYHVNATSGELLVTYSQPSQTRGAIVLPGTQYGYGCAANGELTIEVFSYTNPITSLSAVQNIPSMTRCTSIEYDASSGQFFIVASSSTNINYLITTTISGEASKYIQLNDTVPSSVASGITYPIMLDTNNKKIYVYGATEDSALWMGFEYLNLCSNQCSGHGNCQGTVCTCTDNYYSDDCSLAPPSVTGMSGLNYLTENTVTITGSNFVETTTYSITIGSVPCTDMVFYNSSTISCSIQALTQFSPYDSLECDLQLNGHPANTFEDVRFALPSIESISQYPVNGTIFITGDNFYPTTYMVLMNEQFDMTSLCSTFNSTFIACSYDSDFTSGLFSIISSEDDTSFSSENYVILPWLSSTSPTTISTVSTNVTITGRYFTANNDIVVYQGSTNVTSMVVNDTTIIMTTLNFYSSNLISVLIKNNDDYLNQLSVGYFSPAVSDHITYENKVDFFGTNFPGLSNLISFNVDAVILFQNQTLITIQLPEDFAIYNSLMLYILDDTIGSYTLQLVPEILSINRKPSTNGDSVTLTGNYFIGTTVFLLSTYDNQTKTLNCESTSENNYPAEFECAIEAGSGIFNIIIDYEYNSHQYQSVPFDSSYALPIVASITPESYSRGNQANFTITGTNFVDVGAIVKINGEECTLTNITNTTISCSLTSDIDPTTVMNPVSLFVEINTLSTFENNTLIYEKSCPSACSGHGICDFKVGECKCNDGWSDNSCSTENVISSSISIEFSFINVFILLMISLLFI